MAPAPRTLVLPASEGVRFNELYEGDVYSPRHGTTRGGTETLRYCDRLQDGFATLEASERDDL